MADIKTMRQEVVMVYKVVLSNEGDDLAYTGIAFTFEDIEDVISLFDTVARHTSDTEIYIRMIDDQGEYLWQRRIFSKEEKSPY